MVSKSKNLFLIASIIATIVGAEIANNTFWYRSSYAFWHGSSSLTFFTVRFLGHFLIVLMFWFLTIRFNIKNWLLYGLFGSVVYALIYVFYDYFINTDYSYDSVWMGIVILIEACLAGALGAFPQWFALRRLIPSANKWVIANFVGYGIIALYEWFQPFAFKQWVLGYPGKENMMLYQILQHMAGDQTTINIVFIIKNGLLGFLLGRTLLDLLRKNNEYPQGDKPLRYAYKVRSAD